MVASPLCPAEGNRWALNRACAMTEVTGRAWPSRCLRISPSMGSKREIGYQWSSVSIMWEDGENVNI